MSNMKAMKHKCDLTDFLDIPTIDGTIEKLRERVKARRKEIKYTQRKMALRTGMSYASYRRFEEKGEISLKYLIRIANALGCLEDFDGLFKRKIVTDLKDFEG